MGSFQELEVLDNGGSGYRQATREITRRHRRTCQPLEDYHSNRVAEQGEYPQYCSKGRAARVRFGHR